MREPLVPTIDFSPAKSHLSDVMTQVFHGRQPQLVSRHRGKEQMLLVRPDDLAMMLGDLRIDVQAIYDSDDVTLRVPDLGVLGFGETLDEAMDDLLDELRVYAASFFRESARFMSTSRARHAATLLRFALASEDGQRAMLCGVPGAAEGAARGSDETVIVAEVETPAAMPLARPGSGRPAGTSCASSSASMDGPPIAPPPTTSSRRHFRTARS